MVSLSKTTRALLLCAGAAVLSGCGTRPDIESSTGANAFLIAQAIRCEMRDGLKGVFADATDSAGEDEIGKVGGSATKKDAYDRLANEMRRRAHREPEAESLFFKDFFASMKIGAAAVGPTAPVTDEEELQVSATRYANAAIGYEFDLQLKDTNDVGGSIDILSTLTGGTIPLSPGADLKRTRKATRTFRLLDTFEGLLTNIQTIEVCNSLRGSPPKERVQNSIYPIEGSLRLERLLREFVSLNQSANIVGSKDKPDIPIMAETLVFSTTLTAGLTPTLKLKPLGSGTEITGAKLDLKAERFDEHKLTLTFTMPERKRPLADERSDVELEALKELDRQRRRELDDDVRGIRELISDSQL